MCEHLNYVESKQRLMPLHNAKSLGIGNYIGIMNKDGLRRSFSGPVFLGQGPLFYAQTGKTPSLAT